MQLETHFNDLNAYLDDTGRNARKMLKSENSEEAHIIEENKANMNVICACALVRRLANTLMDTAYEIQEVADWYEYIEEALLTSETFDASIELRELLQETLPGFSIGPVHRIIIDARQMFRQFKEGAFPEGVIHVEHITPQMDLEMRKEEFAQMCAEELIDQISNLFIEKYDFDRWKKEVTLILNEKETWERGLKIWQQKQQNNIHEAIVPVFRIIAKARSIILTQKN